jgi:integrase
MPHGLIFEFALMTGMRPEEFLALQWVDIDFERVTAMVQRALIRYKKEWSFEETKTARTPLSIPNLTYRYFRPILEKAELPQIRLYDLRHSCATLLLISRRKPKGS